MVDGNRNLILENNKVRKEPELRLSGKLEFEAKLADHLALGSTIPPIRATLLRLGRKCYTGVNET